MGSSGCYIGPDYIAPKAPIHAVCGAGGTGGCDHFGDNWAPWTRTQLGADTPGECTGLNNADSQGTGTNGPCAGGYGRVTLHNASHMTYLTLCNLSLVLAAVPIHRGVSLEQVRIRVEQERLGVGLVDHRAALPRPVPHENGR